MALSNFPPAEFQKLVGAIATSGHSAALGVRYVAHGDQWAELAIDYQPRFAVDADTGILASGPIITLMDMATSIAIWARTGRLRPQATLDLRVDYLRAGVPGRSVIGHGECYRVTRHVAFVRGYAHDGDAQDPIAHVAGTYMFTPAA
jgi:uncharacterized protein (TIGR00369 family)